ncbi:hypothetical protein [Pseudofulvibacter geojedonensis]|uniref:Uncharacterized protein n=1 Tax=Pseudofulvibacter geojedonensis TaxID=1123758 RepID=A0ABW3I300_9FLAO
MKTTIRLFFCLALLLLSCEDHEEIKLNDKQEEKYNSGEFFEIESIDYQTVNELDSSSSHASRCNDSTVKRFCLKRKIWAGQNIRVGTFKIIKLEEGKYKIVFRLRDNWKAIESHFYIGDCNSIPVNNANNPKIGNFPIKNTYPSGTNKIVIIFNTSVDEFCVAAHAVVKKGCVTETAWAAGTQFNNNNWATYVSFDGTDCVPVRPPTDSGGTDSGGTDSGGTDSGGTDSGGTDSGGTDSGGTDSGGTDSGGTDSGGTDSGGTDSGGTDSGGTDSGGTDSGGTDSGGTDSGGTDSGGTDSGGTDSGGTDSGGTDSGGTDSGGTDSGGTDSGGTDSGGTDSGGTDSGGTDSGGTDSGGTDSGGTDSGGTGSDGDAGTGSGSGDAGSGQGDGNVDVGGPTGE